MNKPGNPSIQSISGEISSVRSFGNKGWATAMLLTDGQLIRCTGTPLASLREGMNYSLTGKFVHHPRFGLQFDVRAAEIDLAVDRVALQKHIAKSFKNIGPKTAERIVAAFEKAGQLEFLRDQLVYTPECLDFSPYTRRAAEFQGDNTFEEVVIRDFSVRLKSIHEVHTGLIKRLGQFYAQRILVKHPVNPDKNNGAIDPDHIKAAWQSFLEDPFDPLSEVKGYGFKAADAVRIYLGMPDDAPCRLVALVSYVLRLTCEQGGHSYLSYDEITRGITLLDPQIDPQTAITYATEHSRHLKIDGSRYYPLHLYIAETQFAKRLALRRAKPIAPIYKESPEKLDGAIVAAELSMGANFKLDDTQRAAVRGLLLSTSSVHTLTAGPGCGKTAIMEIISRIVHRQCQMLFCAPTGKAAKVLRSRIAHIGKLDALTIHSLLGPDEEGGFKHNEANLLKVDVLTADETSMMDLSISNDLFSAVPLTSHIILLGDTQQLPSIGPGDVLHDLLRIQGFDHHRLNRTHRNTGGILDVISKAGAGVVDGIDRSDVTFRGDLPSVTPEGFASVISDYDDALFQENNKFAAVGFIVPKRKGDAYTPGWNVTYLNQLLRNRYNPNAVAVPGTPLFVNDRVLIRKNQTLRQLHLAVNNAESETPSEVVVNGDTGTICAVSTVEKKGIVVADHLMIDLDDGRRIYYPGNAVDDLDHAYAITCHASQGSEYRRVIFLCTDGPPSFMNRSIVFTALSRAKTDLKVWGSIPKLQRICRHTRPARNSALIETASYLYKQLV